jgi:hypothetical protein
MSAYFVDSIGKLHSFPDDRALKRGLVRAWRNGWAIFAFQYHLKSSYTNGHDYQLTAIHQTRDSFTVEFSFESPLGKEVYCF